MSLELRNSQNQEFQNLVDVDDEGNENVIATIYDMDKFEQIIDEILQLTPIDVAPADQAAPTAPADQTQAETPSVPEQQANPVLNADPAATAPSQPAENAAPADQTTNTQGADATAAQDSSPVVPSNLAQ